MSSRSQVGFSGAFREGYCVSPMTLNQMIRPETQVKASRNTISTGGTTIFSTKSVNSRSRPISDSYTNKFASLRVKQ